MIVRVNVGGGGGGGGGVNGHITGGGMVGLQVAIYVIVYGGGGVSAVEWMTDDGAEICLVQTAVSFW